MIPWREDEDVALAGEGVVAEGDRECGLTMASNRCYYHYRWSHSVEGIWKDEERVAAGTVCVIPRKVMAAMVVFDQSQAFDAVIEGVRCPED